MSADKDKNNFPTMQDFCVDIPLYKEYPIDEKNDRDIENEIVKFSGNLDCYCINCKKERVFTNKPARVTPTSAPGRADPYVPLREKNNDVFKHVFRCSKQGETHKLTIIFLIHDGYIRKIGQYPSLADMTKHEIEKYRKLLSSEQYKEFNRAIGLAANGVGIGSFVYLRRIFEYLIEDAHQEAINNKKWDEVLYKDAKHMEVKIDLLKDCLPDYLVEHKKLYSILSIGLHELSEDECLEFYSVVKLGIKLILDEKLAAFEHNKLIKENTADINKLTQKLSQRKKRS